MVLSVPRTARVYARAAFNRSQVGAIAPRAAELIFEAYTDRRMERASLSFPRLYFGDARQ